MSSPVGSGFPDYDRQAAESNITVFSGVESLTSDTLLGPFYVGNVSNLDILLRGIGVNAQVEVRFYADSALTVGLAKEGLVTRTPAEGRSSIAVAGAWVTFTLILSAYPNDVVFSAFMTSMSSVHVGQGANENIIFSVFNTAIGAGAILTHNATSVRAGMAHFSLAVGSAAWAGEVYVVDIAGNAFFLMDTNQAVARQPFVFMVPPMPLRVIVRNPGVASTYNMALVLRPGPGGA